MAEEGRDSDANPRLEAGRLRQVRRLCELFRGRFTEAESEQVLARKEYDIYAAARFILEATTEELRNFFVHNHPNVDSIRVEPNVVDTASINDVPWEKRQFVCKPCGQKPWWRKVPKRKKVSKCHSCKERYDALDRDKEFGVGWFECNCGHKFKAFAMMDVGILDYALVGDHCGKSETYCYRCGVICHPIRIIPPGERIGSDSQQNTNYNYQHRRRGTGYQRRRNNTHHCTAPNCYSRRPVLYSEVPIKVCVHPKSNPRKDSEFGSRTHTRTGSTVDTFLTQNDDDSTYGGSTFQPDLDDIPENSDDD